MYLSISFQTLYLYSKLASSPPPSSSTTRPKRPRPSSPTNSSSTILPPTNKRLLTPTPELNNLHLTEMSSGSSNANATKLYSELVTEWNASQVVGQENRGENVGRLLSLLKVSSIYVFTSFFWCAFIGVNFALDSLALIASRSARCLVWTKGSSWRDWWIKFDDGFVTFCNSFV